MANKPASLSEIIKAMNSKSKEEVVSYGLPSYDYERIPFTSPRMNYCSFGGIPKRMLTEFFGEEHGGKTTSALDIIANYQQMDDGRPVLYVDAENTLDTKWAEKLGVDTSEDKFICFNPTTQSAEEIFEFIQQAVDSGEIGLWVLDSIPALSSAQELEKSIEDKTYAGVSAPLTVFCRKVEKSCHQRDCTGIFINQIRAEMNAAYPGAMKTPGGQALKHFCTVRMEFRKGKYIDEDGNELNSRAESPAGNYVLMSMVKNKSCPPTRRTGFYTLNYQYGVDYLKDLVDLAIKNGFIEKSGAWFNIINPSTGEIVKKVQGQAGVNKFLEDEANEEVLTAIEEAINNIIKL